MDCLEDAVLLRTHLRWLQIVRQAEELLLLPNGDGLPIEEVSRRLRISARGLHAAFAHVHGVGPGRWARNRRLALVHEALRAAPERRSAVKRAALALGFRHLGHFARAYRERFGELPTDTIARGLARDSAGCGGQATPRFTPPAAAASPAPPAP